MTLTSLFSHRSLGALAVSAFTIAAGIGISTTESRADGCYMAVYKSGKKQPVATMDFGYTWNVKSGGWFTLSGPLAKDPLVVKFLREKGSLKDFEDVYRACRGFARTVYNHVTDNGVGDRVGYQLKACPMDSVAKKMPNIQRQANDYCRRKMEYIG